jgi:hypothetical protein
MGSSKLFFSLLPYSFYLPLVRRIAVRGSNIPNIPGGTLFASLSLLQGRLHGGRQRQTPPAG